MSNASGALVQHHLWSLPSGMYLRMLLSPTNNSLRCFTNTLISLVIHFESDRLALPTEIGTYLDFPLFMRDSGSPIPMNYNGFVFTLNASWWFWWTLKLTVAMTCRVRAFLNHLTRKVTVRITVNFRIIVLLHRQQSFTDSISWLWHRRLFVMKLFERLNFVKFG